MKKKLLVGSFVLIVLVISFFAIYWYNNAQNIRSKVLSLLEQQLEFCSIIKDSIWFDKGEFWLICNNRPFYSTYENGDVSYELNGWGFLKQDTNLWNELNNCDFYKSEKIDNNYNLIFYCPRDFDSDELIAKIYQFNLNSLEMKKLEDKNFLEIIGRDIKSIYSFMSDCDLLNFNFCKNKQPPNLWLDFDCNGESYTIGTNLEAVPLQPPILSNNDSYERRAEISFENSFRYEIDKVSPCYECQKIPNGGIAVVTFSHNSMEISAYYGFMDLPKSPGCWDAGLSVSFNVKCPKDEIDTCVAEFIKYFFLPPLEGIKELELVKEERFSQTQDYNLIYRIDGNIIIIAMRNETIRANVGKSEGIYK